MELIGILIAFAYGIPLAIISCIENNPILSIIAIAALLFWVFSKLPDEESK